MMNYLLKNDEMYLKPTTSSVRSFGQCTQFHLCGINRNNNVDYFTMHNCTVAHVCFAGVKCCTLQNNIEKTFFQYDSQFDTDLEIICRR